MALSAAPNPDKSILKTSWEATLRWFTGNPNLKREDTKTEDRIAGGVRQKIRRFERGEKTLDHPGTKIADEILKFEEKAKNRLAEIIEEIRLSLGVTIEIVPTPSMTEKHINQRVITAIIEVLDPQAPEAPEKPNGPKLAS